jgi:hypothetical protein
MIISIDAEKPFYKFTILSSKRAEETRNIRNYLNIIKVIYDKPIANIILNGEKLKSFSLKSRMRQMCPLSPLLST